MEDAASRAASIEVTYAERTAEVDGVSVQQGQAIALLDDTLVSAGASLTAAALDALAKADPDTREIVTVYWGADADHTAAAELSDAIAEAYPHLEVEIAEGGQPHYPYIISLE
jgi:dihydroxyacetone kinase-like predicted kinase